MADRSAENFRAALARLEEFAAEDDTVPAFATATVKAMEYAYETGWKAMRARLVAAGETPGLPREVVSQARNAGWITEADEALWSALARDRNRAAHVYIPDLLDELVRRIRSDHLPLLRRLAKEIVPSTQSEDGLGVDDASG